MSKQIVGGEDSQQAILCGINQLADVVKVTLAPAGRHVAIDRGFGTPTVTKDGVSVAKEIDLKDPFENAGAQMVREVASTTADLAGDGTTTATVLAQAIYREGLRNVVAGANPVDVKRGIEAAVAAIVAELRASSRPVTDSATIAQVAAISANSDPTIGTILANAIEAVGPDGVISVEDAQSLQTTLDAVERLQFDRGYVSPYFVTDAERMEAVLENPMILLCEGKITAATAILPVLEQVGRSGAPLLVIGGEVQGEALSTLVVNKLRGTLQVVAVKAPGFGDRRKALLEDIAVLTGGHALIDDLGLKLENVTVGALGRAQKVTVNQDSTTILGGGGLRPAIEARVKQLRTQIEETGSGYDRETLQERVAKLVGGIAVIRVGAATEAELREKKARVEDAVHATRAAIEEGIVPGGGVALIRAASVLDRLGLEGDQQVGAAIIRRAVDEPLRAIATNAGAPGPVAVAKVRELSGAHGFNAATGAYEDLMQAGIVDPTKVVRLALQNAASIASLLLTTETMVCDVPDVNAGDTSQESSRH